MNLPALHVRRATVDDLAALKVLWAEMRLPPDDLEPRLTEFQVVEDADARLLGAVGLQIAGHHALLHGEGYADFAVADQARGLFWERILKLAANHGIFRVWTQERSPFWKHFGFHPPSPEDLEKLPEAWRNEFAGGWLTLQLKDEDAIKAALKQHATTHQETGRLETERISHRVRYLNNFIMVTGFTIGALSLGFAIYLFIHRNPFAAR